jgi:two-component system sensor histidine kinase LytS
VIALDVRRTEASISVPTATPPSYDIRLAELGGGRSLLSDDLMLIDAVVTLVGRRVDTIRVESERSAAEAREQEMRRLTTVAELRALRAQLNPHFLFNALNTLGHLMQTAPERALATLYQLTGLLRAVLRRTDGQFVSLNDELEIVESYLAIERERFEERLRVVIDVPPTLRRARVPPLVLQPIVENAVKHGIAPIREGGEVTVRARRDVTADDANGFLRLTIVDTGVGATPEFLSRRDGVGLSNIESRLQHYFGASAAMSVRGTPGGGTTVEICVPWIERDQVVSLPV